MVVKWTADLRTEQVLGRLGIETIRGPNGQQIAMIPAANIVYGNVEGNTARLGKKIDLALAEDYWTCMQSGDAFPAIVVVKTDEGLYQIAGGSHRFQAACMFGKQPTIAAYIVGNISPAAYTLLCQTLNSVEGSRVGREDRVKMAVAYFHLHCVTQREAARIYQIPPNTLGSAIRAQKLTEHLARAGVDASDVNKRWKETLHANIKDAPVFAKLAELAVGGTSEDRDLITAELQSASSEAQKLAAINALLQRRKARTVAGVRLDRIRGKLLAAVKSIRMIVTGRTIDDLQVTQQEASEIASQLERIARQLCQEND